MMSASPVIRAAASSASASQVASPPNLQVTLALLKPTVTSYAPDVSQVLKTIKRSPLQIVRTRRLFWKVDDEAKKFYAEHEGRFFHQRLLLMASSGPCMALALSGPNAIQEWRRMIGPTHVYKSKWDDHSMNSLRSKFGLGDTRNGFHGSDSPESAAKELAMVFDGWDVNWWLEQEQKRQVMET
ncbi:hypothetical protein CF327_g2002 [Tilletia walkeri]|uniref:Nucleoside diphosphate kinase n=1 Tax=Tilletia walkeri TaxID=117179 RepID=A0A8X7T682_9BASI|nr:hypothetical protein CF327_g2002 [Tilletia walkeri]KAE8269593.1 hypothetical protein A4X09_0g2749 [Tilletia walkeri]